MPRRFDAVIAARDRSIGPSATVKRTLPSGRRRMVGPFIFSDQLGPLVYEPGEGMDVRPHPHVGLATVTLTFRGTIVHRDSTGAEQTIRPGEVNWMTAGHGIVHSERSPLPDRPGDTVELLQTWVALPDEAEHVEGAFEHAGHGDLPTHTADGVTTTVMVGDYDGVASPVAVASPMLLVAVDLEPGATHALAEGHPERGVLAHTGDVVVDGIDLPHHSLGVLDGGGTPTITNPSDEPRRVVLLGGAPVGERHIAWNFVASTRERLREAARDWDEHRFPTVPGDDDEREELPDSMRG
ncbi:pirin family protein [Salsipaludibacter albus]|uniref:pirin family protein n=1 Tax=Salsipaludibacter albus TaxID=2849650 RepID=UPI001EE41177|nr:pirin family protein [Salsipaludibacter albus]MBY5162680.1 pirin family protein [Salsipaludibacter albus]